MLIDELYRNKRQRVMTKNGKNITSQLRERKFMLRQFLAGSQNKEEIVTTKKLLSLQMKQEEDRNFVATKYLLSRQEIKEQYGKNTATYKFMLQHNEEHKAESLSRQNPLLSRH